MIFYPASPTGVSSGEETSVPQSLKKRAAELELRVKERAELVKKALREYREIMRAASRAKEGRQRASARLNKKRLHVERANAEYIQLQKELEQVRMRLQARK